MKKYVIVSAAEIVALELKVETYINQGYEPCGGLVVASGRNVVFSQAMWLNPPMNVFGEKLTFDDVVAIGKAKMEDEN